jgi:hypothetical protein
MSLRRRLFCSALLAGSATLSLLSTGCSDGVNDTPAVVTPNALGSGSRIAQIANPDAGTASGATVTITGATFLWLDTYDETMNGKSLGTVYLQDFSSVKPFSGTSLYKPVYEPANLRLTPGDVVDLTGTYTIDTTIAAFPTGEGLIQIDTPVVVPRFDFGLDPDLTTPLVIQASDLDGTYEQGLQWSSMLVTIQNVTLADSPVNSGGRYTVHITSDTTANGPTLDNELFDVETWNQSQSPHPLVAGAKIKSITGIVTWFFNYHLAPRTPADIVFE